MTVPFLKPRFEGPRFEGQRIGDLLAPFKRLGQGWHDGDQGAPFPPTSLHWLEASWQENVPASLPRPVLFATVDGNVSAEWHIERWDASLEVDLAARRGYFHALELDTDAEREHADLDLSTPDGWEVLVQELQQLLGREVDAG